MNSLNFSNYNYGFNPPLYFDSTGTPYSIINGIVTYFFSDGSSYFKDLYDRPFNYDEYGNIFYYDENWTIYYLDENGNKFSYDQFGNVIYPSIESSSMIVQEEMASKQEIEAPYIQEIELSKNVNKIKKTLSDKELFNLFNIKNVDKKIVFPFLSDHSIVWYKVKENSEKSKSISLMSWNLLNRGSQLDKKEFNNPWKIIETENNYKYRIEAQMLKILNIINSIENLSIILLQEAYSLYQTNELNENFILELKKNNWDIIKSEINKPYNLTLYNKNKFKLISSCVQKFMGKVAILESHFQNLQTEKDFCVGNVHFHPKYDSDCIYGWLNKKKSNFLNIFGGDVNQKGEIFIGDEKFPNHINKSLNVSRLTNLFFLIPSEISITVKEMPTCYFIKKNSMSLSNLITYKLSSVYYLKNLAKAENIVTTAKHFKRIKRRHKIEVRDNNDYIKKISQKIDLKFFPYGKLFFIYNRELKRYEFRIYDKNKAEPFLERIAPIEPDYTIRTNKLGQLYTFYLTKKETLQVFKKFLDPDEYSLLLDISDDYNTNIKKDFFEPFIPYSKREKTSRKTQVLL